MGSVTPTIPAAGSQRQRARFEAAALALPTWSESNPEQCAYRGGVAGATQLFLWDRARDMVRQVTAERFGVSHGFLTPSGTAVCWFALDASGEVGRWMSAKVTGGRPADVMPDLPTGHPEGLALADNGTAAAAVSRHQGGTTLCIRPPGPAGKPIVRHYDFPVYVGGITPDGASILLVHAEHGDPRRPALRVLAADGAITAELDEWPASGIDVAPYGRPFHPGDQRILATHDRDGYRQPLLWDPRTGAVQDIEVGLTGDIDATHMPDGSALLLHRRLHGRSELYLYRRGGVPQPLPLPAGTVHAAAPRPDGDVWCLHSAWDRPPAVLSIRHGPILAPPSDLPACHPLREVWADGPGGPVHAFLTEPQDRTGAVPCVFLLHGGPAHQDGDEYRPDAQAWADSGYLVAGVNYHGSSGYGTAWRRANRHAVGRTEITDVAAIRAALVEAGLADPSRCVLAGGSWGGYLALLAISLQPDLWACAIAESPIADFAAAYNDRFEELRAVDRVLFGGPPDQAAERYRDASPISYVAQVTAPVMIIFGDRDPRCPPRQIESYIAALREHGNEVHVLRHEGGHGVLEVARLTDQLSEQIRFATVNTSQAHGPARA
jgi:dienelactone hydrolase